MTSLDRWRSTWLGLGTTADDQLHADLIARYAERERRYHTRQHLDECFVHLDGARDAAERIFEVELALWFHDAVYDVRASDNEAQSADWARRAATKAGLATDVGDRVHELILATRHNAAPATADAALLVDVDLAILGAPPERFDEYERQVRDEYSWVPGFMFRRKRRAILEGFLARPRLYTTERFQRALETRARENLSRSIRQLGG